MSLNPLYRVIQRVKGRLAPRILNKVADYTVTADDLLNGGAVLSNSGATGAVIFAIPAAQPGMRLTAIVKANFNLTLDFPTGDTVTGLVTSGQTYSADLIGETLQLVCVVANVWESIGAADGTFTAA